MTLKSASCIKTINKRQLRFFVKILTFTAGNVRKEAQVHADMHLVSNTKKGS